MELSYTGVARFPTSTLQQDGIKNPMVYAKFFTKDPKPVRTCVAVHQLPLGTDVEIECTAFL